MDTNEASALLEWVNSCPCIHIVYHTFMELKDGIALSTILNDMYAFSILRHHTLVILSSLS